MKNNKTFKEYYSEQESFDVDSTIKQALPKNISASNLKEMVSIIKSGSSNGTLDHEKIVDAFLIVHKDPDDAEEAADKFHDAYNKLLKK